MLGLTTKFPKEIKDRIEDLKNQIAQGQLDQMQYKYLCGQIAGLDIALQDFTEIFEKVMTEDNDPAIDDLD
jgi:hypothetical protein